MGTLFDYLEWRGDLSLKSDPLNNADLLILARISNFPFDGILSDSYHNKITIKQAAEAYLKAPEKYKKPLLEDDVRLMKLLAKTPRLSGLRMFAYQNIFDEGAQTQFAALIIELEPDLHYVSFRGTDYSFTGWQEDCNMYCMFPVPSQTLALEYLEKAALKLCGKFILGGHSKGGNLAVYSAAFCSCSVRDRIISIYNYDGPGFDEGKIKKSQMAKIKERIHTFVPQSSVIGMLLEHGESYTVVKSLQKGFYQHDIFSWEIKRNDFTVLRKMSRGSLFFDRTFTRFISEMSLEDRKKVINIFFELLKSTEGKSFDEIMQRRAQTTAALIKAIKNTDNKELALLSSALFGFIKCAMNNFSDVKPLFRQTRKPDKAPLKNQQQAPRDSGQSP